MGTWYYSTSPGSIYKTDDISINIIIDSKMGVCISVIFAMEYAVCTYEYMSPVPGIVPHCTLYAYLAPVDVYMISVYG